ncbi:MAG: GGDEF domain-containing protein, partial [Magnetococcales bacterium]|nr:GGDEF domain-containing protein [Magnetococcales bacterium]
MDIDLFRNVNDSLGHTHGDQLLQHVAQRLEHALRKGDTISRIGGDEFAFIFREMDELRDCVQVVIKLTRALSEPFHLQEHEIFITASTGMTLYPDDGDDVDTLIKNATIAVNRAKKTSPGSYQFYTLAMGMSATQRLILENHLRN